MVAKELVECIFCHASIQIEGNENLQNYTGHLGKDHRILFDLEHVLSRTLELQPPQEMSSIKNGKKLSNAPKDTTEANDETSGLRRSARNKAKKSNESSEYVKDDPPPDPDKDKDEKDKENKEEDETTKSTAPVTDSISATIQRIQGIKAALGSLQFDKESDENKQVEVKQELVHEHEDDDSSRLTDTPVIKQEPMEVEHFNVKKRSHESAFPESTPVNVKKFARILNEASFQDISSIQFSKKQFTAESTPKPPVNNKKSVIVSKTKATEEINDKALGDILETSQIKKEPVSDSFNQSEQINDNQEEKTGDNQEEQTNDDEDEKSNDDEDEKSNDDEDEQVNDGGEEQTNDIKKENVRDTNEEEHKSDNLNTASSSGSLPWYHGFLYSCQLCTRQFVDRNGFKLHVETNHDMNYDEYQPKYEDKSLKKHLHECENCGKGVFWYRSAIESHVMGQHNMSLDKYYETYKDDIQPPNLTITDETLLTRFMHGAVSNTVSDVKVSNPGYNSSWANKCIYECKLCGKTINSKYEFEKHMQPAHAISKGDYTKQYGQTVKHEEKHHCQIENCKSQILWDKSCIFNHLRLKHDSMTLQQYEDQYMGSYAPKSDVDVDFSQESDLQWANRCIFKCELCQIETNARHKFRLHFKTKHTMTYVDYLQKHGNSIFKEKRHSCQVESCNTNILWDKNALYGHLLKTHKLTLNEYHFKYMSTYVEKTEHIETGHKSQRNPPNSDYEWANQCTFKCALCQIETHSRNKFKAHVKTEHSITFVDYLKVHGKSITFEKRHSCQIESCDAYILWDRSSLYDHLLNKHNMTVGEYKTQYMDNYAEKSEKNFPKTKTNNDDDWALKCTYKCAMCQKESDSRSRFGHHINYQHKSSLKEYTKIHGKSILHEEKHSCQVESCEAVMYWDRSSISGHLKLVHDSMTIEDYKVKYMENYAEKESAKECKNMTMEEYRTSGASKSSEKIHQDGFKVVDTDWSNKCAFICALCQMESNSRSKFQTHMNSRHKISLTEYSKTHGRSISHEEKHSCQVESCETVMYWDRSSISSHLKLVHDNMLIEDYRVKYMDNYTIKESSNVKAEKDSAKEKVPIISQPISWANRCSYKCVICLKEIHSRTNFQSHVKTHNTSFAEYTKTHGKSILHEERHSCQIESCETSLYWDRSSILGHLKLIHDHMPLEDYRIKYMDNYIKKESSNLKTLKSPINLQSISWANRCIYKCALCEMTTKSKPKFSHHIKTNHKLSKLDYATNYGRTMEYQEKHTCQIIDCGSSFWWSAGSFSSHFKLKHEDMTLEKYEGQYMANYVEGNKIVSKTSTSTSSQNVFVDKISECTFSCNICKPGRLLHSRVKAGSHMRTVHKINLTAYKEKYGSSLTTKINHCCHLCGSIVLWDSNSIRNHLYGIHENMPTEEYFNKFIEGFAYENEWLDKVTFECKQCNTDMKFSTKNKTELWEHVGYNHKQTEMEYRGIHGSMYGPNPPLSHSCQICYSRLNWESISLKPHIELKHKITVEDYVDKFKDSYNDKQPEGESRNNEKQIQNPIPVQENLTEADAVALQWTRGSLYKCNICHKGVAGMDQFKKHLESRHDSDYRDYEKNYDAKDYILFSGFHICKICNKNIKHDRPYLENHFKEHRMNITQYFTKHQPKPPKLARMMKNKEDGAKKELKTESV